MVMVGATARNDVTIDDVSRGCARYRLSNYYHGVRLLAPPGQTIHDLSITRSTVNEPDYGRFPDSNSTHVVDGLTVADSTAVDLEFNAPRASTTRVAVRDSDFRDSRAETEWAGWAIGLAHVPGAAIAGERLPQLSGERYPH